MADVTLTYKGSTIAEMNASGSKTLKTSGKYCEGDIGISYVKPSSGGGVEIPDSAFVLSGDCMYWDYYGKWDSFVTAYSDKWSTNNITSAVSMFNGSQLLSIPFQINLKQGESVSLNQIFYNSKLQTLPTINSNGAIINNINGIFRLTEFKSIPNNYFNFVTAIDNYFTMNGIFQECKKLRNIPTSFNTVAALYSRTVASCAPYYTMAASCTVLDEITNLAVLTLPTLTSNTFSSMVTSCYRLKNFTFESGKTVNWKNQTIDLSINVGYGLYNSVAPNYGIAATKYVKDATTYSALKDDPDWFAGKVEYSRYNHDSAVATINSLPDASSYLATAGGTNTIKFKGAAGSATDGGAINTLTADEIAVATAKGWTVSLV